MCVCVCVRERILIKWDTHPAPAVGQFTKEENETLWKRVFVFVKLHYED